jgi:hypothetical protein
MTENRPSEIKTIPFAALARLSPASVGAAIRLLLQPGTIRQWPRLLHEGTVPIARLVIQSYNTAIINRWLNNGSRVVFLSSFPRSGNTWMRYLLSDILLQMHDVDTTTQLPIHPNDLISYFNGHLIPRRLARCPQWAAKPQTAFVKTHGPFAQLEQILSRRNRRNSGDRGCRAVYLYRSPADTLVSLYHLINKTSQGIDDFCRTEVVGWMNNISSYLRAADNGFPVFFISYECLLEKPAIVLGDMLRWLGLQHDNRMAERAVSNMQFGKLQAMEIQQNKNRPPAKEQKLFFRRGGPGSGRIELQESTVLEIQQRTAALMSEVTQRRMKQPSEHPAHATTTPSPSATEAPFPNGKPRESEITPCLQQV